jgi:FKBP-type peptidyl-prolyl cis-trans isomerase SlyD
MSKTQTVGQHKIVTMQYSLTNTDGVVVREATGKPVTYLHGAGTLFPKLERELESHCVGDIVTARLLPDDAFGKRNLDLVCEVALSEFPTGETIEVGGHVTGTDENGDQVTFSVTEIRDGVACLDGNHPLAGQALVFEVEIQDIRDATDEEVHRGEVIS